ncbi:hypothetical protein CCYA_CCYA08G2419 [Cyanidiococcus yangmingshanensis]|nr:hypothetical protein CCYA_CCYA08G2419 [Cyanidiococcus yangmingshanensis]
MLCQVYSSESDLLRLVAEEAEELVERLVPSQSHFREELDAIVSRSQTLGECRQRSLSWTLLPSLGAAAQGLSARCTGVGFGRTRRCVAPVHISKPPVAVRERLVLFMIDYDDTLYPTTQMGSAVLRLHHLQLLAQAQNAPGAKRVATKATEPSPRSSSSAADALPESGAVLDDSVPYPSANQLHQVLTTSAGDREPVSVMAKDGDRETTNEICAPAEEESIQAQLAHDPGYLYALCEQLDEAVCAFLTLCGTLGTNHRMFIVTNADLRWVFSSSRGALPRTHRLLFDRDLSETPNECVHTFINSERTFVCISARGRHGDLRDDGQDPISSDPTAWKVACFRDEIEKLLREQRQLAEDWSTWQKRQLQHEMVFGTDNLFERVCRREPCEACSREHAQFFGERAQKRAQGPDAQGTLLAEETPFDLFVIGDSEYEMEAARIIGDAFPAACLKTIKLIEEPTMFDIAQQLAALADHLPGFVQTRKDLSVRLIPRAFHSSHSSESLTATENTDFALIN